jgi:hypothetical protein
MQSPPRLPLHQRSTTARQAHAAPVRPILDQAPSTLPVTASSCGLASLCSGLNAGLSSPIGCPFPRARQAHAAPLRPILDQALSSLPVTGASCGLASFSLGLGASLLKLRPILDHTFAHICTRQMPANKHTAHASMHAPPLPRSGRTPVGPPAPQHSLPPPHPRPASAPNTPTAPNTAPTWGTGSIAPLSSTPYGLRQCLNPIDSSRDPRALLQACLGQLQAWAGGELVAHLRPRGWRGAARPPGAWRPRR